jgi:hypothetical protein
MWVCDLVLVTLHAETMLHSIFLSVSCPELHIFPQYVIDGTIFGKRFIQCKICVLISSANTG